MKIFALAVFALSFSLSAFADTYFQTLQKEFKNARDPIAVSDFDEIGSKAARECTQVFQSNQEQEGPAHLRKFTIQKEGHGPLLPGKTIIKILFADNAEPDSHGAADFINTTFAKREVQSIQTDGQNDLRVRKGGPYLLFSRAYQSGAQPYAYGYCFSNQSPD